LGKATGRNNVAVPPGMKENKSGLGKKVEETIGGHSVKSSKGVQRGQKRAINAQGRGWQVRPEVSNTKREKENSCALVVPRQGEEGGGMRFRKSRRGKKKRYSD